jgi:DNA mismatch repair ATPase MutS
MAFINKLCIDGYRGIRQLKIGELKQVNLVVGDNNCGKTSFLRALGTAVLFAQNGLFVCAKEMKSSIYKAIFTHFSSAEDDFCETDAAGRFEGEVKEIAAIMDAIEPHSLVLLNETFQTTAYREGAQGMKEILQIFPDINCKYVFVTHMSAIFEIFPKDEATVLTANKFKLTQE